MPEPAAATVRHAIGLSYRGCAYQGWQSQRGGATVQDHVERALSRFADRPLRVVCAGRTDAGVHALNQVAHFDIDVERDAHSWIRGSNRYLPDDIAVQWCKPVAPAFHARNHAHGRRYRYVLLESPVRPALELGLVGWTFRALQAEPMQRAATHLLGEHDFSAFRAAACQAASPVKTMRKISVRRHGAYWHFDFDASAFLHHMVRNLMGCMVAIGSGRHDADWMAEVLASRSRDAAAPTFAPDGLYFAGPYYDPALELPERTPAMDWWT